MSFAPGNFAAAHGILTLAARVCDCCGFVTGFGGSAGRFQFALTTDAHKLSLRMESTLDSVEAAELIVQRMAQLYGFDDEQIDRMGMAVRETFVNAVTHGNGYSSGKSVFFEASIDAEAFRVAVADQGKGFDPGQVADPLAAENLLKASGRGLLMMNAFFDEVEVKPGDETGTKVFLVKYRKDRESQSEKFERHTGGRFSMSLSTAIRDVAGVTIVDLSGRITLGEASGQLRETVRNLLEGGVTKMVLNLAGVSYIDSSGLGELVSAHTTASNKGCAIKLLNVQAKVQDLLQITKLYTVFESHTDEAKAIASF